MGGSVDENPLDDTDATSDFIDLSGFEPGQTAKDKRDLNSSIVVNGSPNQMIEDLAPNIR